MFEGRQVTCYGPEETADSYQVHVPHLHIQPSDFLNDFLCQNVLEHATWQLNEGWTVAAYISSLLFLHGTSTLQYNIVVILILQTLAVQS